MPDRPLVRPVAGLLVGALVAGALTLTLVLLLGGGAPRSTPGLPGAGALVAWALALTPYPINVAAAVTVGFALLGGGFLGPTAQSSLHSRALRVSCVAAWVWVALTLLIVALLALQLRAVVGDVGALLESVQVRALLAQAAAAAVAAVAARRGSRLVLPLALVALVPDLLAGHARTADSPLLAGAAIVAHVLAATLWVGGLVALGWLALRHRDAWASVLSRYSALALAAVVALSISGVVAALGRVGSWEQLLADGYGVVVLLKSAVLAALVAFGAMQRRHVVRRGPRARGRDIVLLAGSELVLMMLVFALATGLAQTPPPT
ncbi:MAG TPA: CopD family protein [Nocardioidaceae bacterium]|nr:CopD family protein [Nocardioidaceae bacterium]